MSLNFGANHSAQTTKLKPSFGHIMRIMLGTVEGKHGWGWIVDGYLQKIEKIEAPNWKGLGKTIHVGPWTWKHNNKKATKAVLVVSKWQVLMQFRGQHIRPTQLQIHHQCFLKLYFNKLVLLSHRWKCVIPFAAWAVVRSLLPLSLNTEHRAQRDHGLEIESSTLTIWKSGWVELPDGQHRAGIIRQIWKDRREIFQIPHGDPISASNPSLVVSGSGGLNIRKSEH